MILDSPDADSQGAAGQDDLSHSQILSNAPMAKSAKLRPTEPNKGIARRPAKEKFKSKYAPEPTAEEYKTFPDGYRLEFGSWPAEEILEVKGAHGPESKRKYLIRWHPHPFTGQDFEPTWVSWLCYRIDIAN
jgi:hypothetical protein